MLETLIAVPSSGVRIPSNDTTPSLEVRFIGGEAGPTGCRTADLDLISILGTCFGETLARDRTGLDGREEGVRTTALGGSSEAAAQLCRRSHCSQLSYERIDKLCSGKETLSTAEVPQ